MKYTFIHSALKEKSITKKTNEIITELWLGGDLPNKINLPSLDRIKEECKKIISPFVKLLKYTQSKTKSKTKLANDILISLKLFGSRIKEVLTANLNDKSFCIFIAKAWAKIIESLIKEARNFLDVRASIIATGLQTELNTVFYEVFE